MSPLPLLALILTLTGPGRAQDRTARVPRLTEASSISLMTCAAGDELYAKFGHSAFRVQDPDLGIDVIYNYGTFDFNVPYFYLKFAQGKLNYSLTRTTFDRFLYTYQNDRRWVRQQVFDIPLAERQALLGFFETNLLPENREYLYDYLFDNCSTITGDVLKDQFGNTIVFHDDHFDSQRTFRDLIHNHLDWNSWSSLGIDLGLGSVIDRPANARERMFLPYLAMEQLRHTEVGGRALVERERSVLDYPERLSTTPLVLTPLFWLGLIALLIVGTTIMDLRSDRRSRWVDLLLGGISGIAGLVVALLWSATDHSAAADNLNVLWAVPTNLLAARSLTKNRYVLEWVANYTYLLLVAMLALVVVWVTGYQRFPLALIPLLVALTVRYGFLLYRYYVEEY